MKKILRFFKYKSKRFIYKFIKFILPIMFSLIIVFSSTLPAYATEWKGNGITLDVYSSYFWDTKNGIHKVTPLVDYTSSRSRVRFESTNAIAYHQSHLYAFCKVEDILSSYGYFHLQIVGAQQTLSISPDSGIYTIKKVGEGGVSTLGEKIIDFEKIDDSNISMYVSSDYPLPNEFIIFISYSHAYDFEVEVRAFDLSFSSQYPSYDNGRHNNEIAEKEEQLLVYQYNEINSVFNSGFLNQWIDNNIFNGTRFVSRFMSAFVGKIPNLQNILWISLIIGLCGFALSLGGSIYNSISKNIDYKRKDK